MMVPTISKKLILAFLGVTIVVLISTLGLARWSFERGFLDYVNALEEKRLHLLASDISQEYLQAGGSWSTLTEQRFTEILWKYSPRNLKEQMRAGIPSPPGNTFELRQADPSSTGSRGELPSRQGPPTALYSASGQLIAGSLPSDSKPIRFSVTVDGEPVGELRSEPRRHFISPQETAFSRQQWITSGLIGLAALVLAIMVSWLLARVLLAPIRRTMSAISQLSNGDYAMRLNEPRTDELGQLMGNLDRLAHKLEQNQASRQRWLADISHELRTPVTVITGEIETMKDGIRPLDMEQLLSLDQEVTRLRRLIDDLYELSVSDIGGLRYSFAAIDIGQSVIAAVEAVSMRAAEKNIDLKITGDIHGMISADSQRLDQLFVNLLENSLAYTDSPGRIEITLSNTGDRVMIKIEDTPPGVEEEECEKLFEPLYRHEMSRSRRKAGAGLGLAICRNIVDAHQGTITAAPSDLGGLRIQLVFPVTSEK